MPYDRIPKDAGAILGQYNIRPYIGITSTPVIDRAKGLMYVVAKIAEPQCPGLGGRPLPRARSSIASTRSTSRRGAVVRQTEIQIPMTNDAVPAGDVVTAAFAAVGALLLANGKVYVAFGAHQDAPPFQGWLMAFDADTLPARARSSAPLPGGEMGGIWQAGNGPAADPGRQSLRDDRQRQLRCPRRQQFGSTLLKLSPAT